MSLNHLYSASNTTSRISATFKDETVQESITMEDTTAPPTTANKLYCLNGNLFFDGVNLSTGGGGGGDWTEDNGVIHPTNTNWKVSIGTDQAPTDPDAVLNVSGIIESGAIKQANVMAHANEFGQTGFNDGVRVSQPFAPNGEVRIGYDGAGVAEGVFVFSDNGTTQTACMKANGEVECLLLTQPSTLTATNEFGQSGFNNGVRISAPNAPSGEVQIGGTGGEGIRVYSDAGTTETASISTAGEIGCVKITQDPAQLDINTFDWSNFPRGFVVPPSDVPSGSNFNLGSSYATTVFSVHQASGGTQAVTIPDASLYPGVSYTFVLATASGGNGYISFTTSSDTDLFGGTLLSGSNVIAVPSSPSTLFYMNNQEAPIGTFITFTAVTNNMWLVYGVSTGNDALTTAPEHPP